MEPTGKKINTVCIIQARMGSSRLPGKVMKDICGSPMLAWVAVRASRAEKVDRVVVATTENPDDDLIADFCLEENIACFRGDEFDVLDRFYMAAVQFNADIIIRLTADCPLIDPGLIDASVEKLVSTESDFCANRLPAPYRRTYPIGLDVEVVTFEALEDAWKNAKEMYEREHVLPYLYNPKNKFKIALLDDDKDYGDLRWTVDTPEDLKFIQKVTEILGCSLEFTWRDVMDVVRRHPELSDINADVQHKSYNDVDGRTGK